MISEIYGGRKRDGTGRKILHTFQILQCIVMKNATHLCGNKSAQPATKPGDRVNHKRAKHAKCTHVTFSAKLQVNKKYILLVLEITTSTFDKKYRMLETKSKIYYETKKYGK